MPAACPAARRCLGYTAALGSAVAMAGYTVSVGRAHAGASDLLLAGTGTGALGTIPAALAQGGSGSPGWAVVLGLGIGVAMMARRIRALDAGHWRIRSACACHQPPTPRRTTIHTGAQQVLIATRWPLPRICHASWLSSRSSIVA